jgi:hypothetical protein
VVGFVILTPWKRVKRERERERERDLMIMKKKLYEGYS